MPAIPAKHVVSFTSQDKNFSADNLLKAETYRKWKCKSPGEKQASVILQFEKSHKISSIDIGNENSAFVEVLVRNSSSDDSDFKVLLPTSSFMSPSESKSETNINRVRMFDSEKLSKTAIESKWDIVKIVCTQPFNKYVQYGLSFVKFHSPQEAADKTSSKSPGSITSHQSTLKLGAFTLKPEDKTESLKPGSLFSKRNELKNPTGAAAIRKASAEIQIQAKITTDQSPRIKANSSNSSSAKQTNVSKEKKLASSHASEEKKNKGNDRKAVEGSRHDPHVASSNEPQKKKHKVSHDLAANKNGAGLDVPFDKIMRKASFVLSGFQNPYRGEIRDKALEMGASYLPDWTPSATHLICAFANTPKYNVVKSKGGTIVKKEWILDCYRKKRLLPWRSYSFIKTGRTDDTSESSDTEGEPPSTNEEIAAPGQQDDEESTDIDTDDEIQRAMQPSQSADKITTDELTFNLPLPDLPDVFKNEHFFLFGDFAEDYTTHSLVRTVVAFGGIIEDYMNKDVNYVVTDSSWDSNFEDALNCNPDIKFVHPKWIQRCWEQNGKVSENEFIITRDSP